MATYTSTSAADTFAGTVDDDRLLVVGTSTLQDGFTGGAGSDTVDYSGYGYSVYMDTWGTVRASSSSGSLILSFSAENFVGSAFDDYIIASTSDEILEGGVGDDEIYGLDGNDVYVFSLGDGNDLIQDDDGDDIIRFGTGIVQGDLTLSRSAGDLVIEYGSGGDQITVRNFYEENETTSIETLEFDGGASVDLSTILPGGDIYGSTATEADHIYATSGNDVIYGVAGTNTVYGYEGNDVLYSGTGADDFRAGDGDDTFVVSAGDTSVNSFRGELGSDTIDFSNHHEKVRVFNTSDTIGVNNHVYTGAAGSFVIANLQEVENVIGTAYDDYIAGNSSDNSFYGGDGNDDLYGNGGDDILEGESGEDKIWGGAGDDWLAGGAQNDELRGGDDNDYLHGGHGNDELYGDAGVDELHGANGKDTLSGGDGNDTLYGEGGNDILRGDDGDDVLYGDHGHDNLYGGAGADTLDGGVDTKIDTFHFNDGTAFSGVDTIVNFIKGTDRIDISDVLDVYYTDGVDDITDFVSISDNGMDTTVSIDLDGTGSTYSSQGIAVVEDTIWANFTQFEGDLVKV